MLIENTELLKEWLVTQLEPICDADPTALAKYVVALVKKDKPENELVDNCNGQLQVFLQDKTNGFVKQLFTVLKSRSYLQGSEPAKTEAATPEAGGDAGQLTTEANQENQPAKDDRERSRRSPPERDDRERRRSPLRERRSPPYRRSITDRLGRREERRGGRRFDDRASRRPAPYWDRERQPPRRFYDDRRDDDRLQDRRGEDELRSDRRDYRRRSRSPDRRGSPTPRAGSPSQKDKSPGRASAEKETPENADSDRDATGAKSERAKSRPKSPSDHLEPRDRADREFRSQSRRRSRSRSRGRPRSASNRRSRSRSWSPRSRSRSRSRSFPRRLSRSRGSRDRDRYPFSGRQRCRDFEEKGYCMQGDFCPFDHGLDPVVVEDINLPLPYNHGAPPGLPPPGAPPHLGPPPHSIPVSGPPPPVSSIPLRGPPPHLPPPDMRFVPPPGPPMAPMGPPADIPYNPEAPAMGGPPPPYWRPPGPGPGPGPGPVVVPPPEVVTPYGQPPPQAPRRDLVTVETVPSTAPPVGDERHVIATNRPPPSFINNGQQQQQQQIPHHQHYGGRGRGRGGYSRSMGPRHDYTNTTLEVRKIPVDLNNIAKLNEHFAKFGTLVNVQIAFDGDREAALVSFATNKQASDAYRSSDPVFNNRFIKVFWHNKEAANQADAGTAASATGATPAAPGNRGEIPPPEKLSLNNAQKRQEEKEKVVVNAMKSGMITKTLYNTEVIKQKMAAITANKASESQKKKEDALKKKHEIQKQKQELLKKLLQEQKGLLDRMDKNKATMGADERATLMSTIKSLATQIETIKKEITTYQANQPKQPVVVRTKQEAQKQILDAELELMTKEGTQSTETIQLRKKLADLKREAHHLGLPLGRGRGRGRGRGGLRGAYSMRGARGAMRGRSSLSVDRRPKSLLVTGYEGHDKDDLTKHFAFFGELESVDIPASGEMVVTFKNRGDAEQAIKTATRYKKISLSMSWYKPAPAATQENESEEAIKKELATAEAGRSDEEEEEFGNLDEELLLGGDDLDDDDSIEDGDRSWRR